MTTIMKTSQNKGWQGFREEGGSPLSDNEDANSFTHYEVIVVIS